MTPFRVYLTNHDRYLDGEFATVDEARAAGVKTCFEHSIWRGDRLCGTWSPLNGWSRV